MNRPVTAAPGIAGLTFLEHLGSGGYSDVYLYERAMPRLKVAVKVLRGDRIGTSEARQFAAEAETMAELADHPNIVQVFSTGVTDDGRPFLVMKYYPGAHMGARAARDRFRVADVLATGVKVASAVETAHRAGILHRDIKPANILVSPYGEPGLTDFGIAGRAHEAEDEDEIGLSVPWSPPEILNGMSNGSIASDVYSLGATVWNLLVGRSPFEIPGGDNSAVALQGRILTQPPPPTGRADVPPSLERLLQQTMAKDPAMRPKSALEFARGLQAIEQEQRFPKTEVLVDGIDRLGTTGKFGPPDAETGEATRFKPPTIVSAQPPTVVAQSAPTPSRQVEPQRWVPDGGAGGGAPPTRARPVTPAPPQYAGYGQHPDHTVQRGAPQAAPSVAGRSGVKPLHLMIAGILLAGAIALGVVFATGGGGDKPSPSPSTSARPTDLAYIPPAPVVRCHFNATKHQLTLSWEQNAPGDYYDVTVNGKHLGSQRETTLVVSTPDQKAVTFSITAISADSRPGIEQATTCGE